ncbi:hypothetical protein DVH05_018798 [Phytophthora capsici]|nr:hypothetical protein DVH05_018798 [Phytophthora capsici]
MSTEVRASKRLRRAVNLHATSATCSKDNPVDFRVIWKSLRRTGWTSKPPSTRGLDNRYRYVRPGGDPNGTDGQDYFLGEKALVDHFNAEHGAALAASGSVESDVHGKCDPVVDVAISPEARPLHHKDTGIGVVSGARQAEC